MSRLHIFCAIFSHKLIVERTSDEQTILIIALQWMKIVKQYEVFVVTIVHSITQREDTCTLCYIKTKRTKWLLKQVFNFSDFLSSSIHNHCDSQWNCRIQSQNLYWPINKLSQSFLHRRGSIWYSLLKRRLCHPVSKVFPFDMIEYIHQDYEKKIILRLSIHSHSDSPVIGTDILSAIYIVKCIYLL